MIVWFPRLWGQTSLAPPNGRKWRLDQEPRAALTTPNHSPTDPRLFAIVVDGSDPAAGLGDARAMAPCATRYACASLGCGLPSPSWQGRLRGGARRAAPKRGRPRKCIVAGWVQGCAHAGRPTWGGGPGNRVCLGLNLVSAVRAPINGLWMVMLAVAVGLAGLA